MQRRGTIHCATLVDLSHWMLSLVPSPVSLLFAAVKVHVHGHASSENISTEMALSFLDQLIV